MEVANARSDVAAPGDASPHDRPAGCADPVARPVRRRHGSFLGVDNLSQMAQQSLVIGTLALGQALVILAAGFDLANAAIAVFATC